VTADTSHVDTLPLNTVALKEHTAHVCDVAYVPRTKVWGREASTATNILYRDVAALRSGPSVADMSRAEQP
jgi:hypothetical protein